MAPVCANVAGDCQKAGPQTCDGCKLVSYCSKDCQKAHWAKHKKDCKSPMNKTTWKPSWHVEHRTPSFMDGDPLAHFFQQMHFGVNKYLWGNLTAVDVLKLSTNEGEDYKKDISLLFAASGDIRNVIMSLVNIPDSYNGHVRVVINDFDTDIVARNIALLLIALRYEPEVAAQMMLHLWYSAGITEDMNAKIESDICLPLVSLYISSMDKPLSFPVERTWTYGTRSLQIKLTNRDLLEIGGCLMGTNLKMEQANEIRLHTVMAPHRKDYLERALHRLPPAWRVAALKFREDGILLPFGASRDAYTVPNPTFFSPNMSWPMKDEAELLESWDLNKILATGTSAPNDIYGAAHDYIHDTLLKFCKRIKTMKLSINMFSSDARNLPVFVSKYTDINQGFDRIELSNIVDGAYVGTKDCLKTFGPMLKSKAVNPHSTLLAVYMNAVHETRTERERLEMEVETLRLKKYLPVPVRAMATRDFINADLIKFIESRDLFYDGEKAFNRYARLEEMDDAAKKAGVMMKTQHTLVEQWPWRLPKHPTQKEFDMMLRSGRNGFERYCEWERKD